MTKRMDYQDATWLCGRNSRCPYGKNRARDCRQNRPTEVTPSHCLRPMSRTKLSGFAINQIRNLGFAQWGACGEV